MMSLLRRFTDWGSCSGHRKKRTRKIIPLSAKTRYVMDQIYSIQKETLHNRDKCQVSAEISDIFEIEDLLDGLHEKDLHVMLLYEMYDGLNLLQRMVVVNYLAMAKLLLSGKYGSIPLNDNENNNLLNLACVKGYIEMARLLLDKGAKGDIEGVVFGLNRYPGSHVPKSPAQYLSKGRAAHYALLQDDPDMLELLLSHPNSEKATRKDLMHMTCQLGAKECLHFLLKKEPDIVTSANSMGMCPLESAILFHPAFCEVLCRAGAPSPQGLYVTDWRHILHKVCKQCDIGYITEATNFLLARDFNPYINIKDKQGETPLHILMTRIGVNCTTDYNSNIKRCIISMLDCGADPNLSNSVGETPFHKLCNEVQFRLTRHCADLTNTLPLVVELFHVFISNGYSVAVEASHIISHFLRILRKHTHNFHDLGGCVKDVLITCSLQGADLNMKGSYGWTPMSTLFRTMYGRSSTHSAVANSVTNHMLLSQYVNEILEEFLRSGLNANDKITYGTAYGSLIKETNYFRELLFSIASWPSGAEYILNLLVTLVRGGGNINSISLGQINQGTSDIGYDVHLLNDSIPSCLTTVLLKTSEPGRTAWLKTFEFLLAVLHQTNIYNLLKAVTADETNRTEEGTEQDSLRAQLEACRNPKSLMSLARGSIAESMSWQLSKGVDSLGLPTMLRDYVMFEEFVSE